MLSTLERLAKARELRDTVLSAGAAASADRRVLLRRKASGLRDLLLDRRAASIDGLDLFNPAVSVPALREHFNGLDDDARDDAAPYVALASWYMANVAGRAGEAAEVAGEAMALRQVTDLMGVERRPEFRARHFSRFKGAGQAALVSLQDALRTHREERAAIMELDADRALELDRRWEASKATVRPYRKAVDQAIEDQTAGRITDAEYKAIVQAYYDADTAVRNDINAWATAQGDDITARRDTADKAMRDTVAGVIQGVAEASPVTREQADAWAAAQTIKPAAAARLRKLGYDPKAVRADMAEFYRLTGGRLARVTINSTGGRRANAEGIHGHASSIINLGSRFDKRVLFHELAHHLEADPLVVAAAKGFLEARRTSERVVRLRDLTGNRAYGPKEVAHEDHWFDAYVGKVYNYDVTEVFSMGMESFCDPATLAHRVEQDPEMFALMLGFLKTPPEPLYGMVKQIRAQTADAESEAAEELESERDDALSRLAAGVTLTNDPPTGAREFWALGSYKATYLGSFGGLDLYACKTLRDPRTKRKNAGHAVIQAEPRDPGEPGRGYGFIWLAIFGGELEAKASMFAWAKSGRAGYLTNPETAKQAAEAYAP